MDSRHATAAIFALGVVVLTVAPVLPDPPYGTGSTSWGPAGGVYLVAGGLLGGRRAPGADRPFGTDRTAVWRAILAAAVASIVPAALRLRDLLIARPELALADATFVLTQDTVFVPVVVAFVAPPGVAARAKDRYLSIAAIVVVSIAAIVMVVLAFIVGEALTVSNAGFGTAFVVVYYGFWAVGGGLRAPALPLRLESA